MSLTVRYPNGRAIKYTRANHVVRTDVTAKLYTDASRNDWIATVQLMPGLIVEAESPCSIKNVFTDITGETAIDWTRELRKFNATTRRWRR